MLFRDVDQQAVDAFCLRGITCAIYDFVAVGRPSM